MIRLIALRELRGLLGAPSTWLMVGVLQFILAWLFLTLLDAFLQKQAQFALIANAPGATQAIVLPLFGVVSAVMMLLVPVFTMRSLAEERRNQSLALLLSSPVSGARIVLGKFVGLMLFLGLIILCSTAMTLTLTLGTPMDVGLVFANATGLFLLTASYAALGLFVSALAAQPLVAALGALGALFGLWLVESNAADAYGVWHALAPTGHFRNFSGGLIESGDVAYFLLFCAVLLRLTARRLDRDRIWRATPRKKPAQADALLRDIARTGLLLAGAVALYLLAARYPLQQDITQTASFSLAPGSVQALRQLQGPVHLTVLSTEQDARLGDIRKQIRRFVEFYQRYKRDITLSFIDPVQQPEEAQQADIQANGEMVVEYEGRREHLTTLSEQALTSALLRLAHRDGQLVMYVTGHGERKLDGAANADLGEFGKRLGQTGFRIGGLNLALAQDVPANASLLVLTQPQVDWLPGELDKLMRYVDGGGSLLWLLDAEPLHGLQRLSDKLGLVVHPGIVIDPDAEQMRAPVTWALGSSYPAHAITRNFNVVTAFPFARALGRRGNDNWQSHALVEAAPRGWVSTQPPRDARTAVRRASDTHGPVSVALALQRNIGEREQRVVVAGSGAFLANTYVGNGGNLDLGVNMVNWLSNQDKLIAIAPRATRDHTVTLGKTRLAAITIGLLIVLPLLFGAAAGVLWWRRKR